MASRVLVTPEEVIEYSVFAKVKNRPPNLLELDILQASTDIYTWCGHNFDDTTLYPEIPPEVRLAAIKLTEYYALMNSDSSYVKGYQSESIGNYSYTLATGQTHRVSLGTLLSAFGVKSKGLMFRMRSI